MSFASVMMPMFVEILLTFALLFLAGALRSGDLRAGTVTSEDIGLRELHWPQRTAHVSNAYSNQTQLPSLFYVLTILAYFTHHAGTVFVLLAWVSVALRLLHAGVHVTRNNPNLRGMLAVMWATFMIEVLVTDGWLRLL